MFCQILFVFRKWTMFDLYRFLNLSPTANKAEIQQAIEYKNNAPEYPILQELCQRLLLIDANRAIYNAILRGENVAGHDGFLYLDSVQKQFKQLIELQQLPTKSPTRFVVVDVETANPSYSSICQIGTVVVENGVIVDSWQTLINPMQDFTAFHSQIHGITPADVQNAPKIDAVREHLQTLIADSVLCSYGNFDQTAFNAALSIPLDASWLDITRVVRRTWTQFAQSGYGLGNICYFLNIDLSHHHDALADAQAAAHVLLRAMQETDDDILSCFSKAKIKIKSTASPKKTSNKHKAYPANPEGELFGEFAVFTGALSVSRDYAAQKLAQAGCEVTASVSKKTTLLIYGTQDESKVKDGMSSKEKKALEYIQAGQNIRMIDETDFFKMLDSLSSLTDA